MLLTKILIYLVITLGFIQHSVYSISFGLKRLPEICYKFLDKKTFKSRHPRKLQRKKPSRPATRSSRNYPGLRQHRNQSKYKSESYGDQMKIYTSDADSQAPFIWCKSPENRECWAVTCQDSTWGYVSAVRVECDDACNVFS